MATIYVNPTASGTGSGTIGDPYSSWASVTWVAGNTYLQASGTTYSGVILVNVTGTQAAPIIVGSYDASTGLRTTGGSGRARINGDNTRLTVRSGGAVHWVTFDNLEIFGTTGTSGQNGIAIYLGSSESSVSNDCTVSNCWIHDVTGLLSPGTDSDGIMAFGSRNKIVNNIIEDISCDGIWGQGNNFYIMGNTIRRVSVENTRGDCVQLYGTTTLRNDGAYVAFNDLDHNNKESKQCIISGDATYSSNALIEYNVCRMATYAGSIATSCIMAEGPNSIVRGNVCQGGYLGVYLTSSNSVACGNVVTGAVLGIQQGPSATGGKIYNNVVSECSGSGIYSETDTTVAVKNNIVTRCDRGVSLAGGAAEDYNCFDGNSSDRWLLSGVASWGANDLFINPMNYMSDDFRLRYDVTSPLMNGGTYVAGAKLMNGRARPGWTPVGAYMGVVPRATAAARLARVG